MLDSSRAEAAICRRSPWHLSRPSRASSASWAHSNHELDTLGQTKARRELSKFPHPRLVGDALELRCGGMGLGSTSAAVLSDNLHRPRLKAADRYPAIAAPRWLTAAPSPARSTQSRAKSANRMPQTLGRWQPPELSPRSCSPGHKSPSYAQMSRIKRPLSLVCPRSRSSPAVACPGWESILLSLHSTFRQEEAAQAPTTTWPAGATTAVVAAAAPMEATSVHAAQQSAEDEVKKLCQDSAAMFSQLIEALRGVVQDVDALRHDSHTLQKSMTESIDLLLKLDRSMQSLVCGGGSTLPPSCNSSSQSSPLLPESAERSPSEGGKLMAAVPGTGGHLPRENTEKAKGPEGSLQPFGADGWRRLRRDLGCASAMELLLRDVRQRQTEQLYDGSWTAFSFFPPTVDGWRKLRRDLGSAGAFQALLDGIRSRQLESLYEVDWTAGCAAAVSPPPSPLDEWGDSSGDRGRVATWALQEEDGLLTQVTVRGPHEQGSSTREA